MATDPKNLYAPHENDGKFFQSLDAHGRKKHRGPCCDGGWPCERLPKRKKPVAAGGSGHGRANQATENKDFIFWVGHSTFFMRINGQYWLTDPMFSDRALLPKRKTPPGITIHEILAITDQVNCIISHNHYDHLDENSIRALPELPDSSCQKE
ncbi:MAG: MBL fold metallo-hydrolase [Desulfobacterales bacterium]